MTEDGKMIAGGHGGKYTFAATLLVKSGTLKAGKYILRVHPRFNGTIDNDDYKKIAVDCYTT